MKLPKYVVTWAAYGVISLTVLALLWLVVQRVFFLPTENATRKATAITKEETAGATANAAEDALGTVNEVHREYIRTEEITRRNEYAVKTTPGADTRVPAVAGALERGLCEYRAYSSEPRCASVLGNVDGVGPSGKNSSSAATGQ